MKIPGSAKSGARNLLHYSSQTYRTITQQLRLMPDFIIIGGQRCGTSSLYFYLADHPYIAPAYTKELHFFDANYNKGQHWYRAQFPTTIEKYYTERVHKHVFVTGEASPSYLFHPQVPKRISKLIPDVKLIVLLRNPIDRAYSAHWLNVRTKKDFEPLPFREALECEEERIAGEREKILKDENYISPTFLPFSYLARGIYVDQLQHWMNYYPREQFLIIRSEDLYSKPAETVKQTLQFLGVPEAAIDTNKEYKRYKVPTRTGYKVKSSHPKMDPETREYLINYYKPHNARLREFLNRDFDWDK